MTNTVSDPSLIRVPLTEQEEAETILFINRELGKIKIEDPETFGSLCLAYLKSDSPNIVKAVAAHPGATPEIQTAALERANSWPEQEREGNSGLTIRDAILIKLARNPNATPEILMEIMLHGTGYIPGYAAENPNADSDILMLGINHEEPLVRLAAAGNRNSDVNVLRKGMVDVRVEIRIQVAGHPNISEHILAHMETDKDPRVLQALKGNPRSTELFFEALDKGRMERGGLVAADRGDPGTKPVQHPDPAKASQGLPRFQTVRR